ncbi:MAG TPA: phage tail assembly chaperone [Rhizomicrobium sp.]|jgi:uncharacterized phage protein (TIGR02216 family)
MRLPPQTFWAMSLPEWRAAVSGFQARRGINPAPHLGRDEFAALMARYPDGKP